MSCKKQYDYQGQRPDIFFILNSGKDSVWNLKTEKSGGGNAQIE
jgi:hypothetical protein